MAPKLRFFSALLLLALAGFPQSFAYAQSDLARAYRVIASKHILVIHVDVEVFVKRGDAPDDEPAGPDCPDAVEAAIAEG